MHYKSACGGNCCKSDEYDWSKMDRKTLLIEKKAILEAKVATINHWIENLDEDKSEDKS